MQRKAHFLFRGACLMSHGSPQRKPARDRTFWDTTRVEFKMPIVTFRACLDETRLRGEDHNDINPHQI